MIKLPEKTRKTLERLVNDLKNRDNVIGVGLFGSWSRNEATPSSDIDLLILDKNCDREHVDRVSKGGSMIDLDHIPNKWTREFIPPEVDQKFYDVQILYDRDWSLANTKLVITKVYSSPERIDIRTAAHIVNSDIYLSRATSALSKEDCHSAYVYSCMALENVLRAPMEMTMQSFSTSHFVELVEKCTVKLGMPELYNDYLSVTGLTRIDSEKTKEKLKLFRTIWGEVNSAVQRNAQAIEQLDPNVKTELAYYLNPLFVQGVMARAGYIIDTGSSIEASRYLRSIFVNIIENYVWLKHSIAKAKTDSTITMKCLENLERKSPRNYQRILDFLDLKAIGRLQATRAIGKTREIMRKVRGARKALIKTRLAQP